MQVKFVQFGLNPSSYVFIMQVQSGDGRELAPVPLFPLHKRHEVKEIQVKH